MNANVNISLIGDDAEADANERLEHNQTAVSALSILLESDNHDERDDGRDDDDVNDVDDGEDDGDDEMPTLEVISQASMHILRRDCLPFERIITAAKDKRLRCAQSMRECLKPKLLSDNLLDIIQSFLLHTIDVYPKPCNVELRFAVSMREIMDQMHSLQLTRNLRSSMRDRNAFQVAIYFHALITHMSQQDEQRCLSPDFVRQLCASGCTEDNDND